MKLVRSYEIPSPVVAAAQTRYMTKCSSCVLDNTIQPEVFGDCMNAMLAILLFVVVFPRNVVSRGSPTQPSDICEAKTRNTTFRVGLTSD